MAEVFRRPSLTGLEVLWRWVFWCIVLGRPARSLFDDILRVVNGFQAGGFPALGQVLVSLFWQLRNFVATHAVWLLAALVLWFGLSALGRRALLRRISGTSRASLGRMALLSVLQWVFWAVFLSLWGAGMLVSIEHFITAPQAHGSEASWVPFCAVVIAGTLVVFVLWLSLSWVFPLTAIHAARGGSFRESWKEALRGGPVRSKLAEINLVLGIVKIALIVLAMVFSASPLPFETVETQSFLVIWTTGVLLLYVAASDYFHVVRWVAFLRMTEVFASLPPEAAARRGEVAS